MARWGRECSTINDMPCNILTEGEHIQKRLTGEDVGPTGLQ